MNIINYAINILGQKAKNFEETAKYPMKAQEKVLFDCLSYNRNTSYGLEHNFSKIKFIVDYQKLVPLNDYEQLRPYMLRIISGERNVLTAENPVFFSITSGTTGEAKFIPVTKTSRAKKTEVMNLWMYYMFRDYPDITKGKILAVVNSEIEGYVESGLPYGAETGHGYKNLPLAVKHICALPYNVFEIKDYVSKYYCILRIALEQNITAIATMNPSTILLLCGKIEKNQKKLIEDIEKGTIDSNLNITPKERKELEKFLKPNPARAQELRGILDKKKILLPKDIWPNMKLIMCWKGGTVGLYLKEFPFYFANVPVRDFGYLSSEARASVPITNEGAGGVLAIHSNFYEFIPKEDFGKDRMPLLASQLEKGREYFIIITTPAGLYRYDIGDVVRVIGFFNNTPIIEFVQRGLNVSSLTGEKLYEFQVVEAVNKALDKHKLFVEFFTASIQWGNPPRYVFLVEFNEHSPFDKKKDFLKSIEDELAVLNIEYGHKRESLRLGYPILKVVEKGEFERYRTQKIKLGVHDSQFKIPKLTTDLNFQKQFSIKEEILLD